MTPEQIRVGYYSLMLSVVGGYEPDIAIQVIAGGQYAKRWTDEEIRFIFKLRNRGFKYKEIASYYGTSVGNISKVISKNRKKAV